MIQAATLLLISVVGTLIIAVLLFFFAQKVSKPIAWIMRIIAFILLILIALLFMGKLSLPSFTQTPTQTTQDETANWNTYTNDEYGFGIILPEGWKISYIEKPTSADNLPWLKFSFIPPEGLTPGWSYWGILYMNVCPYQPNIDAWLDWFVKKSYPNLKDKLVAEEIYQMGGKPTFMINMTGEGVWQGVMVTLGSEHSYSYAFSQDGAPGFVQRIMEEIFPHISIR